MNIITNQFRFVTPKTIMLIFKKLWNVIPESQNHSYRI